MATIKFFTRTKIEKLAPVNVRYIDGRKLDLRVQTPFRIYPSYWNEAKQKLTQNILYSDEFTQDQAKDIEDRLTQLKDSILRASFKLTAAPTEKWLRGVIDDFYYKPQQEHLTQYIKRFVEEAKSGKRLSSAKKKYSYGSCRVLTGFMQSWEMFCKDIDFDDITQDTYNDYLQFLYKRNCSGNYAGRRIANLKTIMRAAREEGLHNNHITETRAFKVIKTDSDSVYLTADEVQSLYNLKLSSNKEWEVIRDVFLIGCYTAQRYSDYSRITKNNIRIIDGRKYIEIIQKKTGEKCIIPVSPQCDAILKKYEYTLPKTYEQIVNATIKAIAGMAKINDVINYEQQKGGLRVKKSDPKYKLIRTHTARRTGCSLMYLAGVKTIDIMKISGHKTEKEFLRYVKLSKEETAVTLSKHPYFTGLKVV